MHSPQYCLLEILASTHQTIYLARFTHSQQCCPIEILPSSHRTAYLTSIINSQQYCLVQILGSTHRTIYLTTLMHSQHYCRIEILTSTHQTINLTRFMHFQEYCPIEIVPSCHWCDAWKMFQLNTLGPNDDTQRCQFLNVDRGTLLVTWLDLSTTDLGQIFLETLSHSQRDTNSRDYW